MQIGGAKAVGKLQAARALHPLMSDKGFTVLQAPRSYARMKAPRLPPPQPDRETRIPISRMEDIVNARQAGCALVQKMGFSGSRMTLVTTAISELARNILLYACKGEIVLSRLNSSDQLAVCVVAIDLGPGIDNIAVVMAGGFSTSGGLGLGLSGLRRIVDEFEIRTQPGNGTQVSICIRA